MTIVFEELKHDEFVVIAEDGIFTAMELTAAYGRVPVKWFATIQEAVDYLVEEYEPSVISLPCLVPGKSINDK